MEYSSKVEQQLQEYCEYAAIQISAILELPIQDIQLSLEMLADEELDLFIIETHPEVIIIMRNNQFIVSGRHPYVAEITEGLTQLHFSFNNNLDSFIPDDVSQFELTTGEKFANTVADYFGYLLGWAEEQNSEYKEKFKQSIDKRNNKAFPLNNEKTLWFQSLDNKIKIIVKGRPPHEYSVWLEMILNFILTELAAGEEELDIEIPEHIQNQMMYEMDISLFVDVLDGLLTLHAGEQILNDTDKAVLTHILSQVDMPNIQLVRSGCVINIAAGSIPFRIEMKDQAQTSLLNVKLCRIWRGIFG